jgi:hypothetical protein
LEDERNEDDELLLKPMSKLTKLPKPKPSLLLPGSSSAASAISKRLAAAAASSSSSTTTTTTISRHLPKPKPSGIPNSSAARSSSANLKTRAAALSPLCLSLKKATKEEHQSPQKHLKKANNGKQSIDDLISKDIQNLDEMFVFSKSKAKSNVRKSVDELEEDFREQTRFRTPNKHKQMQEEERRRRHHQH